MKNFGTLRYNYAETFSLKLLIGYDIDSSGAKLVNVT